MKKLLFLAIAVMAITSVAADPFNAKLSSEEKATLARGEVLIRNIDKMKHICVNKTAETKQIIDTMQALDPVYTAEIIQVRPYKGNEDLLATMKNALLNISDYKGIPYWSVRVQKWYELYDSAVITSLKTEGSVTNIQADLEMSPFGIINAQIHLEERENYLYYDMTNLNKLRYHDRFNVIKPKKMKSAIAIFRDGDNWILYAIGGVDTYKIFFLEDRVETSFINRIKTFCNFIFSKI